MSNNTTKRMIAAYIQEAPPTLFMSGFFQSPPQNFHNSEEVEIDIVRTEEDISIAIQDLSTGYSMNAEDIYTNKSFKPPIHKEAGALNAFSLIKRTAGQDPFKDPDFEANAIVKSFALFRKTEAKIKRAIEDQSSQVLQNGVVSLKNGAGDEVYSIDYKPKATHFPTSGTAWDQVGDDKLGDLKSLSDVIRGDGLGSPNKFIMGDTAFDSFQQDATIRPLLDNRRISVGEIAPEARGQGATFRGFIWIGNYRFEIWTYSGRYTHPQTKVSTPFMDPGKVVVLSDNSRFDATFGAIPRIAPPDNRVMQFMPGRVSNVEGSMDMFMNAWLSDDGEQLFVGSGARPLMIPTAIDTYGCLTTGL